MTSRAKLPSNAQGRLLLATKNFMLLTWLTAQSQPLIARGSGILLQCDAPSVVVVLFRRPSAHHIAAGRAHMGWMVMEVGWH